MRERHGQFGTPEYHCWAKMIQRCTNPRANGFQYWGGRGVKICERWRQSFSAFMADMGPRPSPKHSIDRINNDADYTPENCRWVCRTTQNRNRSNTLMLTWKGRTMTLAEWAKVLAIPYVTLQMRLLRHWPLDRAFTEPLGEGRRTTPLGRHRGPYRKPR